MLNFLKIIRNIILLGLIILTGACLKGPTSSNTSGFSGLSISGQILDTEGKPATQAFVFVEGLRQAAPFVASNGNFQILNSWLKENIHQMGRLLDADELLKEVTGKDLDCAAYLDYLDTKYRAIYKI